MTHSIALIALVLALVFAWAASADGNLLPNPSFEESADGQPVGWAPFVWAGKAEFTHAEIGREGGRSLCISSTEGADLSWSATVAVQPMAMYRLSAWIKTENVRGARGALLNIHNIQPVQTPAVTGTTDWTEVEVVFETGMNDSAQINCLLGGWGQSTGTAWYDDISLELLNMQDLKASVSIDATNVGEPISPLIYGQFIEHLGRCIYGGVWAEMLEDRKFYYAVGADESPWDFLGRGQAVTMATDDPYVGEHTPVLHPSTGDPAGISQSRLGLVEGRDYTGRIVLTGDEGAGPVRVSLIWADGPRGSDTLIIDELTDGYLKVPFAFTAGATTDDGILEVVAEGDAEVRIGTVSLMPADNLHGMRADTLELLRQLDAPVYRWPGGNFVSGYNWRDGIGDRDRRPPRKNPAWTGVEHNDFGLDEFMLFCRELGTEPYIAVNTGAGQVDSAIDELLYANAPADSPMGRQRAANGHPEPYGVEWWGLGNEMYGNWQIGHMPLEDYQKKSNQFAEAFWAVDPSLKLVAVGDVGPWSEGMMANCADHMTAISEHFYCQEAPGLLSHVRQIPDAIRRKVEGHRRYRETIPALEGKDIRIAMDEWNYWYGEHLYGELGTAYFLKDALGIAAGIHEFARQSDMVVMANYAQTVNVIGCIKTTKTDACFDTTGLVLKLYREHYGVDPVTVAGDMDPLDVAAAWNDDHSALTIAVVNPTTESVSLPVGLEGAELKGRGTVWTITGPDAMSTNTPGGDQPVKITEKSAGTFDGSLDLAPLSVSLFEFRVR